MPTCVLGDYNQRIPRMDQAVNFAKALADTIPADFRIVTNEGNARSGLTELEVWEIVNQPAHETPAR